MESRRCGDVRVFDGNVGGRGGGEEIILNLSKRYRHLVSTRRKLGHWSKPRSAIGRGWVRPLAEAGFSHRLTVGSTIVEAGLAKPGFDLWLSVASASGENMFPKHLEII